MNGDSDPRIAESYRILELNAGASAEDIKRAYRDLARVWHPDRFLSDDRLRKRAEGRLAEINAAYEFLISIRESKHISGNTGFARAASGVVDGNAHAYATRPRPRRSFKHRGSGINVSLIVGAIGGLCAVSAILAVGPPLLRTVMAPFQDVGQLLRERTGVYTPPAPPAVTLLDFGETLQDHLSSILGERNPAETQFAVTPHVSDRATASNNLRGRKRPRAETGDKIMPAIPLRTDVKYSRISEHYGMIQIFNETEVELSLRLGGAATPAIGIPAQSAARIRNIPVGIYRTEVRPAGSPVGYQFGPLQFLRVQDSGRVYSDQYDIIVWNAVGAMD